MREENLPICCKGGTWVVRDSAKRFREVQRRGYSSLPRIAVCSKCGNTKFIDPGVPDEEFIKRRNFRKNKTRQQKDED